MARGPRVDLRPMTVADAVVVASWGLDASFRAAAEWSPDMDLEALERFHRGTVLCPPEELLRLAACAGGDLVGYVDLHGTGPDDRELGYVVGPSTRWGQGLGTALARAGLDYGFGPLGLRRVTAEAWDANPASIRILQRLGMRETGRGDAGEYLGRATYYRTFQADAPLARAERG